MVGLTQLRRVMTPGNRQPPSRAINAARSAADTAACAGGAADRGDQPVGHAGQLSQETIKGRFPRGLWWCGGRLHVIEHTFDHQRCQIHPRTVENIRQTAPSTNRCLGVSLLDRGVNVASPLRAIGTASRSALMPYDEATCLCKVGGQGAERMPPDRVHEARTVTELARCGRVQALALPPARQSSVLACPRWRPCASQRCRRGRSTPLRSAAQVVGPGGCHAAGAV